MTESLKDNLQDCIRPTTGEKYRRTHSGTTEKELLPTLNFINSA